jgi:hypothetical protein
MSVLGFLYCLIILTIIVVSIFIFSFEKQSHISATPTLPVIRKSVIKLIRSHTVNIQDIQIAELGCGWGGLLRLLAYKFPNAKIIGYELSPIPYLISRISSSFNRKISIISEDFFLSDWSEFDVLVCYLSPYHMEKIAKKIARDHFKGLVISCSFPFKDIEPIDVEYHKLIVPISVFAYRF